MAGKDVFYDYSSFDDERVEGIFKGWDGLGGYHGLLIKLCARLFMGETVLDVGCGLCHLYEALMTRRHIPTYYCGVDNNPKVLEMARERYPTLDLYEASVYDLSEMETYDTVFAVGLYREEPRSIDGIHQMVQHADKCVVLTYFAEKRGRTPEVLLSTHPEYIEHNIDERLEIVRIWTP